MPGPTIRALSKQDALNQLLEDGMTMVYLDARTPGVDVPPALRGNANLRLNVSRRFPRPLEVEEGGMTAVLSFGGNPYRCIVPWKAVFGMFSHVTNREVLWPEDIPRELVEAAEAAPAPVEEAPRARPEIRPVPPPEPLPETEAASAPVAPTPPRRGHLRLVK